MSIHNKCPHDIEEELRDGAGKTIAMRCTVCLRVMPWGPCPGACGKRFTMLPARIAGGGAACSDACAHQSERRRTKHRADAKKAAAKAGRGQVAWGFLNQGDVLTKARG